MQFRTIAGWRWHRQRGGRALPYDLAESMLLVALTAAVVMLGWTIVKPLGPVGHWQALGSRLAPADPAILTRFDPFFRSAASGSTAVTSLPLKLFGVRIDQAMGRGSAIIATPDGLQNSYAVGDEVVPGVKLKSVSFDSVTITRGVTDEQLFLDQSVAAAPAAAPTPAAIKSVTSPQALAAAIDILPRLQDGKPTGVVLNPKGSPDTFNALGLRPGDVLTQINSKGTMTIAEASAAIASLSPGTPLTFTVERGGQMVTVAAGGAK